MLRLCLINDLMQNKGLEKCHKIKVTSLVFVCFLDVI